MFTDGRLYEISPAITVTTFYGLSNNFSNGAITTLDELYSTWDRFNTGGKEFITGMSAEDVSLLLISFFESEFVDKETATCTFNSTEFIKLLEFTKSLPINPEPIILETDITGELGSFFIVPEPHYSVGVQSGDALLGFFSTARQSDFPIDTHYRATSIFNNADIQYTGIPGTSLAGFFMEFPVAVLAASERIDGTREFIDKLWSLSFMGNGGNFLGKMPMDKSVLDKFLQNYYKYGSSLELKEKGILRTSGSGRISPYTIEDFDEFLKIIDTASVRMHTPITFYISPVSRLLIPLIR
jgi:hypothetical protein